MSGLPLWHAPAHRHRIRWSRPSGRLRHGTLAVRTLGASGPPLLLLHGLGASGRYWGGAFDRLGESARLIVPDLLGFGASPRPPLGYGPEEHADAIAACLRECGADDKPALVVGHSLGSLIALAFAARYPGMVAGLVGFGPPLYRSASEARRRVGHLGLMVRLFTIDSPWTAALCAWTCAHREAAGRLVELLRMDLPAPIARDSVRHSWPSFSGTVERVILASESPKWLQEAVGPVCFVVGAEDKVPDMRFLGELSHRYDRISSRSCHMRSTACP